MTKTLSINNKQISIELTSHFLKRITERNISLSNLQIDSNILTNILNSEYKKHIIKNLLHNITIIIKKDSPQKIAFITAMSGLFCDCNNANVINLH